VLDNLPTNEQRTKFVVTKPFEVHESGAFLHGTKANLSVGDLLVPGANRTTAKDATRTTFM